MRILWQELTQGTWRWLVPHIQTGIPVCDPGPWQRQLGLESEPCAGISQDGGSAAPGADLVLGRVWFLKLRADKRSGHEGISAFDVLPFGSC